MPDTDANARLIAGLRALIDQEIKDREAAADALVREGQAQGFYDCPYRASAWTIDELIELSEQIEPKPGKIVPCDPED